METLSPGIGTMILGSLMVENLSILHEGSSLASLVGLLLDVFYGNLLFPLLTPFWRLFGLGGKLASVKSWYFGSVHLGGCFEHMPLPCLLDCFPLEDSFAQFMEIIPSWSWSSGSNPIPTPDNFKSDIYLYEWIIQVWNSVHCRGAIELHYFPKQRDVSVLRNNQGVWVWGHLY